MFFPSRRILLEDCFQDGWVLLALLPGSWTDEMDLARCCRGAPSVCAFGARPLQTPGRTLQNQRIKPVPRIQAQLGFADIPTEQFWLRGELMHA